MGKYQKYSDEFKKEAVRLLESTGKPKTTIEQARAEIFSYVDDVLECGRGYF